MHLFKRNEDLHFFLGQFRKIAHRIGFVPTMGALHQGHLSLVQKALEENDLVICSIFVNPTQFDDRQDLATYPRPIEEDFEKLEKIGCQVLYLPDAEQVYPEGIQLLNLDLNGLDRTMEGTYRAGHFKGVVQVVHRLLDIVRPDALYMGQKDFQQYVIVKYMIKALGLAVRLVSVPIVREVDGLAMSSRNIRLGARGRQKASWISKVLFEARREIKMQKNLSLLKASAIKKLKAQEMEIDYFEIINTDTLQSVKHWDDAEQIVACTSVRVEKVRLLDNILLKG